MQTHQFNHLKGQNVVIYGTGLKAEWLIDNANLNIAGLLDGSPGFVGKDVHGHRVITIEDAICRADSIIIAASAVFSDMIYRRISSRCKTAGVKVYYFDGTEATESTEIYVDDPYYQTGIDQIKRQIDQHTVISFDLFDTLITRKLLEPADIHYLVDKHKSQEYRFNRLKHEHSLGEHANLKTVFDSMFQDKKIRDEFLKREERFERILTTAREDVIALFNYAKESGKRTSIVTDTPHSEKFIKNILKHHGIDGWAGLLVSSSLGKTKAESTLWKHFIKLLEPESSVLHIGDNTQSDIANSKALGIDAIQVKSCRDMLCDSSLKALYEDASNPDQSIIAGHIATRLFNSPFALKDKRGQVIIESEEDLGYVFYGPIIFTYIAWIARMAAKQSVDSLLFCARDGYFLHRLYKLFSKKYKDQCPRTSHYFITSRIILTKANIRTLEDLKESLKLDFKGSLSDCLRIRYDLKFDIDRQIDTRNKNDYLELESVVLSNARIILEKLSRFRDRYLEYVQSVVSNDNIAIVDPSYNGTIQHKLQKLISRKFPCYYMNANLSDQNPYSSDMEMYALYQDQDDPIAEKSSIRRNTLLIEDGFLVAPTGTPISINRKGSFIFWKKYGTQREFSRKIKMFNGVKRYFNDMFDVYKIVEGISTETAYIDRYVRSFCEKNNSISKNLKCSFKYDSLFYGEMDSALFAQPTAI